MVRHMMMSNKDTDYWLLSAWGCVHAIRNADTARIHHLLLVTPPPPCFYFFHHELKFQNMTVRASYGCPELTNKWLSTERRIYF